MFKIKKVMASVVAAATVAAGSFIFTANAANVQNTTFTDFMIPPHISGNYSQLSVTQNGIRVKTNNSSVYVQITEANADVSTQTWGLEDSRWTADRENCTCNALGNSTYSVVLQEGQKYQIYNTINENGYACAGLQFRSASQYNTDYISGVWSPDYSYESGVVVAGN